ncbi:MAG TPA: aminotransferase class I/II-fold pyridoxal phosphate-dependent enzyme [Alphaproteobacteria bacterium]|nr:aminotransferase class I/II-fold pyridoxal phosphate-dependent enzyme [Alphaproteobacteria bacterium]
MSHDRPDSDTHPAGSSLSAYYNASQLRADAWNRVKHNSARLAEATLRKAENERVRAAVEKDIRLLEPVESYWAFPGKSCLSRLRLLFDRKDYGALAQSSARINRALISESYRGGMERNAAGLQAGRTEDVEPEDVPEEIGRARPYFEVLIVDTLDEKEEENLRIGLRRVRRPEDPFVYELVVVPSFEDALIAVLFNHNIQACVIRYGFAFRSQHRLEILQSYLDGIDESDLELQPDTERGPLLGAVINTLRPEIDLYLVTDVSVEDIAGTISQKFRRIFYRQEDYLELHLSILRGVSHRFDAPFFSALRAYARQPTGVFHALPISRGKSIVKSHWIQDMAQFYGINVFLAETSATSGGLDSLLYPSGPLKAAQEMAARAFGARHTFFVTNGTSTANKIVVQALVQPGDIVLVDRDCHKSHHYGLVLAGAQVHYLDSYPLHDYSMYGAVPLSQIKEALLQYRRAGKLDRVRLLLLTNCTFDGVVYNVERVMEECLAIKPDLIFLWDEAWFAFARFTPTYRQRTAMAVAERLRERYRTSTYRKRHEDFKAVFDRDSDQAWLTTRLLPDPDKVRVRAYSTQSTHKTLTSLRQGSMIHINDQDFKAKSEEMFHEAYMTHTSTSPNYQILASLDVGRRQVELEGYELVQKQVEMAMVLRESVATHPLLRRYFRFLTIEDVIPAEHRQSGIETYYSPDTGWSRMEQAWAGDEFVLDPTRLTLYVGPTGIDGNTFKNKHLMDKFGIQINKTSRNTVLFMTNIGTTRSSIAYLIEVLVKIAQELDESQADASAIERRMQDNRVNSLCQDLPPLPDFTCFHDAFRSSTGSETREGDIRQAYFLAYDEDKVEYILLAGARQRLAAGRQIVSANFVTPYPPGFPILVPGQVVSDDILTFIAKTDVKEIHGYRPEFGLRVFTVDALTAATKPTAAAKASVSAAASDD